MRKPLKILIAILVLSLLVYLFYGIVGKIQFKNEVEKSLQSIPDFSFKTLKNKDFTNADLEENMPTIFIYFNTECDFCQHEIQNISENIACFKDAQLLFVSIETIKTIKVFADNYHLLNKPNITFLQDNTNTFSSRFDANSIPFLLVYNKKQELITRHKGQLKAEAIVKLLEN